MNKLFTIFLLFLSLSLSAQLGLSSEEWQKDLSFLQKTVNQDYPFLFKKISADEWNKQATLLSEEIPTLPEHKIVAGLRALVSSFAYGHTFLTLDDKLGFHRLPISLYAFNDGVYIEGCTRENKELLGARVIKIGETPIEEAIQKIRQMVPAENDQFHIAYGLNNLRVVELLHATDIINKLTELVPLTLEIKGEEFVIQLAGEKNLSVPREYGYVSSDSLWIGSRNKDDVPYYLKNLGQNYYYELLPDSKTVYVRQSRVRDEPKISIHDFYQQFFQFIQDNNAERLVIDVRLNGGGNNYKNKAVITQIIENKDINQIGNLMVIIGRRTFSACQNLVNELSNYTNAVFVGEPTAENINFYGDNRPVTLPNSKLTAYLSFAWWQDKPQWANAPWLAPHVAVDMSYSEFINGEDPVLQAALDFDGDNFILAPLEYITELFTTGQMDKLQSEVIRMIKDPRYKFFDFEEEFNKAGMNLLASKQNQEAVFVFNMTSSLFPQSAKTLMNLGEAMHALGDDDKAKIHWQKALELNPKPDIVLKIKQRLAKLH